MYLHTHIHTKHTPENKLVKENALGSVKLVKSGTGNRDGGVEESNE